MVERLLPFSMPLLNPHNLQFEVLDWQPTALTHPLLLSFLAIFWLHICRKNLSAIEIKYRQVLTVRKDRCLEQHLHCQPLLQIECKQVNRH